MTARRAKIVCTIGPASREPHLLRALAGAGMDVARLNFSHGTHDEHARVIADLRRLEEDLGRPIAILQDLQGPKIRIGLIDGESVRLEPGAAFTITTAPVRGDRHCVSTTYGELPLAVVPGDHILLSDGLLRLQVLEVAGVEIRCEVIDGGSLRQRAGINLPGAASGAKALTDKDRADLAFGLEQGVDFVALSFVRSAADIDVLRRLICESDGQVAIIAKLEKPQALDHLDDILAAADVVMVARGDLGVELSPEAVPFVQKDIIRRAAGKKVPVITATQMLESMTDHPRPTRAEASDVANAILDGTDAVMLSGETAVGKHPVEAVAMMDRIVREAERHAGANPPQPVPHRRAGDVPTAVPDALARAACEMAADVGARAVIAFTESGFTARLVSKFRPATPILAVTPHLAVARRLALYWGVEPRRSDRAETTDEMLAAVDRALLEEGLVERGDPLAVLAGTPVARTGTTNLLKLHRAGDSTPL